MHRTATRLLTAALLMVVAVPTFAASYIVPSDADLIRNADAIAIVTIESSHSYIADNSIATDYRATVERWLKSASVSRSITITQRGGIVGGLGQGFSGEPAFESGERALLLLQRFGGGRFTTFDGELGKFRFSGEIVMRGESEGDVFGWDARGERHIERARDAEAFLRYIEKIVAGETPEADYQAKRNLPVGSDSHTSKGGNEYTQLTTSHPTHGPRWQFGTYDSQSTNTQTGVSDLTGAIDSARGLWNGSGAPINIKYLGGGASGPFGGIPPDFQNLLFFDGSNTSDPDLAGSRVGFASYVFFSSGPGSTHTNGPDTYFTMADCDVKIEAGLTGNLFVAVLAHEDGHCLGFRHSNEPSNGQTVSTGDALMNSVTSGNAALRPYDVDAASHVYGTPAPCTPPSISQHPQSVTITQGNSTTLSVTASGTAPLTYQWYIGTAPNTASPTGTNSSSLMVNPATTTSYWVRVTGCNGNQINSNTATVTVNPPACTPPSISTHPQSVSITQGNSTVLSVVASGSGTLSYQWYIGTSGNTSNPTGTNSNSLTVNPSSTTSYWVRVTGCEGNQVSSNTATVTVNPPSCTPPSISTHPQSVTITQGNFTTLTVVASGSGTLSYQWYIGTSGNTSNPTGTNSNSLLVNPSATTSYWVRVTGCEGNVANSNTATVTVTGGTCTPPSIATQPQSVTITEGQTTFLSVTATGTAPFIYQWFIGTPPSMSNPTGTNSATLSVSPTVTTTYWVRVIGQCDPAASSNAVTVTVTPNNCPNVTVGTPTATNLGNGTFQLNVTASGGEGALTYQWFQGPVPGVGTFIGTGQQISVPTPTTPTSYWVRVSNNCGKQGTSPTVVTISPGCDLAVITTEPADQTIANGASATLNVVFTSATTGTVRWYRGVAPDKSNEIGTGNSVSTGPLTATTQFFATITNSCGEKFTRTVTITVGAACTSPVILAITPAQATKIKGETVTLNVIATGTATLNYQWFEGTTGDTSKLVGTNSATFTSDPLTTSTRFWVRVTNGCGNASSNTIVVDVKAPRRRAARH